MGGWVHNVYYTDVQGGHTDVMDNHRQPAPAQHLCPPNTVCSLCTAVQWCRALWWWTTTGGVLVHRDLEQCGVLAQWYSAVKCSAVPVSYTHLTLPTKRIV